MFLVLKTAIIMVCIEIPWLNSEKLLFSILLGKSKKKSAAIDKPIEVEADNMAKN